ncbi:hypothetical protein HK101_001006 [Irineochytrium annulatum]|nr:hypothetical protein HK101_001006 [Irineochytrium annulatum]
MAQRRRPTAPASPTTPRILVAFLLIALAIFTYGADATSSNRWRWRAQGPRRKAGQNAPTTGASQGSQGGQLNAVATLQAWDTPSAVSATVQVSQVAGDVYVSVAASGLQPRSTHGLRILATWEDAEALASARTPSDARGLAWDAMGLGGFGDGLCTAQVYQDGNINVILNFTSDAIAAHASLSLLFTSTTNPLGRQIALMRDRDHCDPQSRSDASSNSVLASGPLGWAFGSAFPQLSRSASLFHAPAVALAVLPGFGSLRLDQASPSDAITVTAGLMGLTPGSWYALAVTEYGDVAGDGTTLACALGGGDPGLVWVQADASGDVLDSVRLEGGESLFWGDRVWVLGRGVVVLSSDVPQTCGSDFGNVV